MKHKCLSQEALKLIACTTMLIDHIGVTLVLRYMQSVPGVNPNIMMLYNVMRFIGRIAFPIYCFLLVEGTYHTRNPKNYGLRLFVGMLLSEIPFDLAFSFRGFVPFDWTHNSVMVTLLLGFLMIQCMMRTKGVWKVVVILPFYILAEVLHTDYDGVGILMIALFALSREVKHENLLRIIGCAVVLCSGMRNMQIFGIWINSESFAMLALIPIFCYDGRKLTNSKAVQLAFYLFYPVHILILALLENMIFG